MALLVTAAVVVVAVAVWINQPVPPTSTPAVTPISTVTSVNTVVPSAVSVLIVPSESATHTPTRTPTPAATATAIPLICPYAPPPRLVVGGLARVILGQGPAIIRETPNTSSTPIRDDIPAGQILNVLDGPECGPTIGRMWWRVSYQGIVGWTTEGSGDTYFLEPVSGTP
jgi:hypothetical protein